MLGITFFGGVHPPGNKKHSAEKPIEVLADPDIAYIPLQQHIGAPSKAIVNPGDTIKVGQPLSEPGGFVSVPVHASIAGTVKEIVPWRHPLGMPVPTVVIEKSGQPEAVAGWGEKRDITGLSPKDLIGIIQQAGIAGMGGATFPTHVKLSPPADKPIDTLILNGVECEPYLTADYRLMLERGEHIIEGIKILKTVLQPATIIIAIEANKPKAIAHLKNLVKDEAGIQVKSMRVKYPQGAEKQLIYALTHRKVPCGGLPMDVGCLVQNAGTTVAVYEAVCLQKPLIERIVTVTGSGINKPKNLQVKIGTPMANLLAACGGLKETAAKIISGGPMMGIAQFSDGVPIIKGSSGVLVLDGKDVSAEPAHTCISCGSCVDSCPMKLVPTMIAKKVAVHDWDGAISYGLTDCIECGCCTFICPAKIDIVHHVKFGKSEVLARAKKAAAKAKK